MDDFEELIYIDKTELSDLKNQKNIDDKLICIKRKNDLLKLKEVNEKKYEKKNNSIIWGCVFSCIIILSYIFTNDMPEVIEGIEIWYNLVFQFSIAYLVSAIFYYITVYKPEKKRRERILVIARLKIDELIDDMEDFMFALVKSSVGIRDAGCSLELSDIKRIEKIDFGSYSDVVDIKSMHGKVNNLKMSTYLTIELKKIQQRINDLLSYYNNNLTMELLCVLEEIKHTFLHDECFQMLIENDLKVDFRGNNDFFVDYYNLIQKLKNLKEVNILV